MALKNLFETPKDRLIAITDGVYAIAMTILALELSIPAVTEVTTAVQMNNYLLTYLIPAVVMYIISFYLVATFWENSLLVFGFDEIDSKIQNINFLALAFVCLIPFATGFLFEFWQFRIVNIVFSVLILIISLLYLLMFYIVFKKEVKALITKHDLSSKNMPKTARHFFRKLRKTDDENDSYIHFKEIISSTVRTLSYLFLSPVITSIISLLLAFVNPFLSIASFVLVLFLRTIIRLTNRNTINLDDYDFESLTDEEKKMYSFISNLN